MSPPNIFGADIAGEINAVLGPLVFTQTLIKLTSERDPANSTNQIETAVSYPCKGFIDEFEVDVREGTRVRITDRKIVILGASLPAGILPEPGDKIVAENITFTIVPDGVSRDPAGATYECQAK